MIEEQRIRSLREALSGAGDLFFTALFGSALGPHWRQDSDIDIAILPRDSMPLARELALGVDLSLAGGREVDVVNLDDASTVLKHNIATSGRLLIEFEAGAWAAWRARSLTEYWDFEPTYKQGLRNYEASLRRKFQ